MLDAILDEWQFQFWLGLACLAVGTAVVSPFLLSRSFRKWFSRTSMDLERIGLGVLVLAVVIIGLYNRLGR